jgi:hypothetical protein
MAIGLTARQRSELAAMLPNIEESVASLRRLIADAKDRTRALSKLSDAEEAHKRHAAEVGIPFNAEAFAKRRAELNALPKMLTVEEGQLASFVALQRAIGVVVDGPYVREGRGGAGRVAKKSKAGKPVKRGVAKKSSAKSKKAAPKAGKKASRKPASPAAPKPPRNAPRAASLSSYRRATSVAPDSRPAGSSPERAPAVARGPVVKPLPLALGS